MMDSEVKAKLSYPYPATLNEIVQIFAPNQDAPINLTSGTWVPYWKLKVEGGHFSEEKGLLTVWWLRLIEETVDKFLTEWEYDFDAVPFEYLDVPPKSLVTIKHNLHIIRTLLLATSPRSLNADVNSPAEKER